MAIPTSPATPEQMQIEAIQELDRMRMMSIQSLAMQRIRDSVVTLSRETGFRERPVEQFSQAPLFIPQYRQWSNTLGQMVGTDAPSGPVTPYLSRRSAVQHWERASKIGEKALRALKGETVMGDPMTVWTRGRRSYTLPAQATTYEALRSQLAREGWAGSPWLTYLDEYSKWQQAQQGLPA